MSYTIFIVDCSEKHRQVIRHFINRIYSGVNLIEYDPCVLGPLDQNLDWSQYHLLIIDNILGNEDGLAWVKACKEKPGFPPVIFLSSMPEPGTPQATQLVIESIRLGAENFLFKKGIQVNQLNNSVLSVLRRAGYDPENTQPEMLINPKSGEIEIKSGVVDKAMEKIMGDTVHEMELAMVMLHGHTEWPFTMTDILAGKAMIGEYKITSYLGRGDNTTTFKAKLANAENPVILKLIGQSLSEVTEVCEQCLKDISEVLKWNHPNLVRFLHHEFIGESMIIVQEFIQGDTFSERLSRSGALKESEAVHFFLQLLTGLIQLHSHGIAATNLSPRNMVFRDLKTLVITNFGIIRRMHALNQITGQSSLGAEAAYVSPEKVQKHQLDTRTDLYTVGVILYEMLAGYPPFHTGTSQDILYAHVTAPVPVLPDEDHPMNRVIQGLMMKTPAKRIQTAEEVKAIVEKVYGVDN